MKNIFIIISLLITQSSAAQFAINSAGSSEISIGNVFYNSYESGNFQITEGVLQAVKNGYPLSLSDIGKNEVKVFPNPFEDIIIINDGPIGSASIYSIDGRLIISEEIEGPNVVIKTSGVSSGFYILKIKSRDQIETFKIVKQ